MKKNKSSANLIPWPEESRRPAGKAGQKARKYNVVSPARSTSLSPSSRTTSKVTSSDGMPNSPNLAISATSDWLPFVLKSYIRNVDAPSSYTYRQR